MSGPLEGIKIVEFAGIGPGPMCAMLLADLGAKVLRIDRKTPADLGIPRPPKYDTLLRNRDSIALDLKRPESLELALELIGSADGLIEGFRPGTMERLGLGPNICLARNPGLVYGRITGWGQEGPLAPFAGHDINYLSITGVLDAIGPAHGPPSVPLNIVGDYAGGSLYLAVGMLAAILHARRSGHGQVVDAAIVDGVAHLSATYFGMLAAGIWQQGRSNNIVDGGAPFYGCFECLDGKFISVGPVEKKFFDQLARTLGVDPEELAPHMDRFRWPKIRSVFSERFREKTSAQWAALLEHTDACATGVVSFSEAPFHPHMLARQTFVDVDGVTQPAPAPRFSVTKTAPPHGPRPRTGDEAVQVVADWLSPSRAEDLRAMAAFN
jgi:Predicted acyl-CoA transferases/carnitine dehydratase